MRCGLRVKTSFQFEGSMLNGIKVGDIVTIKYRKKVSKKVAISIKKKGKKTAIGD